MVYNDYIKELSEHFDFLMKKISANYNFDLGDEFEIALCEALQAILPSKFGICRGHVYSKDGKSAGDDIIIYDHERFPHLRILTSKNLAQKQYIPMEAVYAYIEAKYTVQLEGESGQSLDKALKQVANIKKISREPHPINQLEPYFTLEGVPVFRKYWPNISNPVYGVVWAYNAKMNSISKNLLLPEEIYKKIISSLILASADLIIVGNSVILIPTVINNSEKENYVSLFQLNESIIRTYMVPNRAFAIGVISLLFALDAIRLGKMPYPLLIKKELIQGKYK